MSNDKMREEFEAWVLREYPNQHMGRFATGEYHSTVIEHCWQAWRASRAALVIELPKIVGYEGAYDSFRDNDFAALPDEFFDADETYGLCRAIEVQESIEAAGVKVKP
ncbi:hypothetical protein ACTACK_10445 [Pseudomonas syringae]|uniref:hypothetical protein n=1 Tax=Pseudomonas syringae TaxID=317 RepID=UPI003F74AE39